jgi:heptosyltransferase III
VRPGRVRERGNAGFRFLDRYAGIPLVAAGAVLRRRRRLPDPIRSVGVLNSTNIGDTVLLAPVVQDLARSLADSEVVLFAGPRNAPIARLLDGITVATLELSRPLAAIRTLRAHDLDVLLDFDQWPRVEPVLCMLSGATWTAGFRSPRQHRHYAFDGVVDHSDRVHELENYRRLAGVLGVDSASPPSLTPPGALSRDELPDTPFAVLHLWPTGLRSELKEWPWERWRELSRRLVERGLSLVLTGSAADAPRTREFLAYCGDFSRELVDVSGKYDLAQVVDLLAASRCAVSVNTGVMHVAAAVGAPTVGLNGPTSERRWGPIGERAISVNSSLDGCGYLHFGWEYRRRREDCMLGISVERVFEAAVAVMGDG